MENIILVAVLLIIVGSAAWYVIKAKKSGKKCIGCPEGSCTGHCGSCGGSCGCGHSEKN